MSTPIAIKLQDLISSARAGKLHDVVERETELARLTRILLRPTHHHAVLVADPGSGKSSLVQALALRLQLGHFRPLEAKMYLLQTEPILALLMNGEGLRPCLEALRTAAGKLGRAIVVIEDIQLLTADEPNRLELTVAILQALSDNPDVRLIVTTTIAAYHRYLRDNYVFGRSFEALELLSPSTDAVITMVEAAMPRLERTSHQTITPDAVEQAIGFGQRFGHGRANPDAAIRLLEDTTTRAELAGNHVVTADDVQAVVAERERLPQDGLTNNTDLHDLASLETSLHNDVLGQATAIKTISTHIARARLGLGDPSRPRSSFLLLGPSGVGKTETAKALARHVYHNPAALIRLDMSEYSEPHAAVRLIGSPPGYVGYEEGGQLTSPVQREPYSLILLDEIEKAHPKLFDLFLQLLDDGRLTDSSGRTADFTQTMVLATSNVGSTEIATAAANGVDVSSPQFMQTTITPLLLRTYRPEFINRFDAILAYQPLTITHLVALAQRRLTHLARRLEHTGVSFNVANTVLGELLTRHYNPLFGARPVARVITEHFETPLITRLIQGGFTSPLVITGTEEWLNHDQPAETTI